MRRTLLSATAATVVVLGWLVLAGWLGLPSAEPAGFLPFVFGAFAALVAFGRWLARTGFLLALLPVYAVFFDGWAGIGDES